jgi:predicted dehydrogenase
MNNKQGEGMAMKPFQLGIAGCGRISQSYLDAVARCPGISLMAVMDIREHAANTAAEANKCRAFTDVETMLQSCELDGVVICTPPSTHADLGCQLLEAGLHVLCEKPFATTVAGAERLIETSRKTGRTLMMATKFRYVDDVIRAKSVIASGMLGVVRHYSNCFSGSVDMEDRWNSNPEVAGGGVLIDNGTHSVDLVRYLLGPIVRVYAYEGQRLAGLAVEDTVNLFLVTENQAMAVITLSWTLWIESPNYVEVTGTEGALCVGWKSSKYKHGGQLDWADYGSGYDKVAAFRNQLENFADATCGAAAPSVTMEDGLWSTAVIEAAYASLATGEWVDVETPAFLQA